MKPIIRVNHKEEKIELNKEYFKRIQNPRSEEYETLQMVRKDYPHYEVCLYKIKRNPNKKTYKGLNYEYMETYIKDKISVYKSNIQTLIAITPPEK